MQSERLVPKEDAWEKMRRQAMQCLEGYKKKEALALLTQMAENRCKLEKNNNLQRVIDAVKDYDYEKAIQLLRDM